uniref:Uncharacterized protein n=1 Tax=Alexandrium catenella TaxID=2925 RepID=A0A6T9EMH0_ALECA
MSSQPPPMPALLPVGEEELDCRKTGVVVGGGVFMALVLTILSLAGNDEGMREAATARAAVAMEHSHLLTYPVGNAVLLQAARSHHDNHDQKHGEGGPGAVCDCLLACEVFGGDTAQCIQHRDNSTATKSIVENLISSTLRSHSRMCEGMRCVKECAKSLGCLDKKILRDCGAVKAHYAKIRSEADPDCDLLCDS